MTRCLKLFVVCIVSLGLFAVETTVAQMPAHRDVAYDDDHPSQCVDVYLAQSDQPTPAMIYIHGGGWRGGSKRRVPGWLKGLVAKGQISVVAVEYRFTNVATHPAQVNDCLRAVQFVRHNAAKWNIDPKRLGVTGGSAGGHLSAYVALHDDVAKPKSDDPVERHSSRLACAVSFAGPTDWALLGKIDHKHPAYRQLIGYEPGTPASELSARLIKDVSPISFASADDPPIMQVHGDKDTIVPIQHAQNLHQKLTNLKVSSELVVIPGGTHGVAGAGIQVSRRASEFVRKHLLGQADKRGLPPENPSEAAESESRRPVGRTSQSVSVRNSTDWEGRSTIEDDHQLNLGTRSEVVIPQIDGDWWQVAGNPDLGEFTSDSQEPVDFGVWQAADGTWQLWSCIRKTNCGGNTRLFHGWEGRKLTDKNWRPLGIVMQAEPKHGESPGGLQAPHVIRHQGTYYMFYGDWSNICMATSKDGKTFKRVVQENDKTGMFNEGDGEHARDPMILKVGERFHCYYTAHSTRSPEKNHRGVNYCRLSTNLRDWGESKVVAEGSAYRDGPYCAECPHVVYHAPTKHFYLFNTQQYRSRQQTTVFRSPNPLHFGINDNRLEVTTLPVAAPVIHHGDEYYIASLKPTLDGIQIARLRWINKTR